MAKYIVSDIFKGNFPISQYYGNNPSYYSQFGLAGHEGVDWATPIGTEIIAPFNYKILRDNDDFKNNAYGDFIVVWDPIQKCAVWFCHLSENYVSLNQTGKKGDVLGKTGNSGNSSGPHLHIDFVETDSAGNRLNTNNGFQGFLNILDSSLVEWKLGGSMTTQSPSPTTLALPPELQHYSDKWKEVAVQKGFDINGPAFVDYRAIDLIISNKISDIQKDIKGKQETIDNLNQQINDRNNDIIQLNAKISTLENQVLELQTQNASLSEQAKKLPGIMTERDSLIQDKKRWILQEAEYKKQIKQLQGENEDLKKNWLSGIIKIFFKK